MNDVLHYTRERNVEEGRRASFALRSPKDVEAEFVSLCLPDSASASLLSSGKFQRVFDAAMDGKLSTGKVRSICWKFFLEYIPPSLPKSEWMAHLTQKRAEYVKLRDLHMPDPTKVDGDSTEDLAMFNPLSMEEDSPWQKFYEGKELIEEIEKDLGRLYPTGTGEYFEAKPLQRLMLNILFVWSKIHSDTSYRQGMHELLAPIVYALEGEKMSSQQQELNDNDNGSSAAAIIESAMNPDYVEADAFWLFAEVMKDLKPLFRVQTAQERKKVLENLKQQQRMGMNRNAAGAAEGRNGGTCPSEDPSLSPLLALCARIQHRWLRQADPKVYKRLLSLGIEPQLYAMKWARLMFGREFHMEDVMALWDTLFAMRSKFMSAKENLLSYDPTSITSCSLTSSIELVSVAMVMNVRDFLLERDYSQALKRLMKYPPMEDVRVFAKRAHTMRSLIESGKPLSTVLRETVKDSSEMLSATTIENHPLSSTPCASSSSDTNPKARRGEREGNWMKGTFKSFKSFKNHVKKAVQYTSEQTSKATFGSNGFKSTPSKQKSVKNSKPSPFASYTSSRDVKKKAKKTSTTAGAMRQQNISKPFNFKHTASASSSPQVNDSSGSGVVTGAAAVAKVNAFTVMNLRLGAQMDRLTRILDSEWAARTQDTRAQQVMAELRLVRDVLLGRLDEKDCNWGLSDRSSDEENDDISSTEQKPGGGGVLVHVSPPVDNAPLITAPPPLLSNVLGDDV
eukprot:g5585.t1